LAKGTNGVLDHRSRIHIDCHRGDTSFRPWLLSWFGRLPGDIRIVKARATIFIPITSMLLISIVATLLINFFKR